MKKSNLIFLLLIISVFCISCMRDDKSVSKKNNDKEKTKINSEIKEIDTKYESKNETENKITIGRAKLTKENELYFNIGNDLGIEHSSHLYDFRISPSNNTKKIEIKLMKSNKNMSGWEQLNKQIIEVKDGGLLKLSSINSLPYKLYLKYEDISGNNIGIDLNLDLKKEMKNFMGTSLSPEERMEIVNNKEKVLYNFVFSDEQENNMNNFAQLKDNKPSNINQYIVLIKLAD